MNVGKDSNTCRHWILMRFLSMLTQMSQVTSPSLQRREEERQISPPDFCKLVLPEVLLFLRVCQDILKILRVYLDILKK